MVWPGVAGMVWLGGCTRMQECEYVQVHVYAGECARVPEQSFIRGAHCLIRMHAKFLGCRMESCSVLISVDQV